MLFKHLVHLTHFLDTKSLYLYRTPQPQPPNPQPPTPPQKKNNPQIILYLKILHEFSVFENKWCVSPQSNI